MTGMAGESSSLGIHWKQISNVRNAIYRNTCNLYVIITLVPKKQASMWIDQCVLFVIGAIFILPNLIKSITYSFISFKLEELSSADADWHLIYLIYCSDQEDVDS